jgi:two-component system sensor histidine kinase DegS
MDNDNILKCKEMERKRIAEDLHDTTVQDLVHLSQQIELALLYMDDDLVQTKLELLSAKKNAKNIINDIRNVIFDLKANVLKDIGWRTAFERLEYKLRSNNSNININFDVDEINITDSIMDISIYRVISEACQNIIKHSNANNVWIVIKVIDNYINIVIRDDGVGFKTSDNCVNNVNHFGLEFMKEKVMHLSGIFNISSDYNKGTVINIQIPLL